MEALVALSIGVLTAGGVYLMLRARTFPVILGLTLLSYAVNVFVFTMGRLSVNQSPVLRSGVDDYADPLPQALVLTAIVINFGMTAISVVLALRTFIEVGDDHVDLIGPAATTDRPDPAAERD